MSTDMRVTALQPHTAPWEVQSSGEQALVCPSYCVWVSGFPQPWPGQSLDAIMSRDVVNG